MFSLTLQRPCESDPQLPGAVGQEGLKGSILPAALKQKGLRQEAAWAVRGQLLGEESGAINAAIFLAPCSAGLWEMLLPTQGKGFW